MDSDRTTTAGRTKPAPLEMHADDFRAVGHWLVDQLADFYAGLRDRPVTTASDADQIRAQLGGDGVPLRGRPADELFSEVLPLCRDQGLHNGHPRFFGYITSSGAPIGALADLLASAMNPNVGKWDLAPVASEIEAQTVRWIAQLIGFPSTCGGLMASGGNLANILAFLAARRAVVPWDVREAGLYGAPSRLTVYASRETHTWIEKAADVTGIGTGAIRWIATGDAQQMRLDELEARIVADRRSGRLPVLVVGTAGSVSTGAIDPLDGIADVCARHNLWFHVDGAYGAPVAMLPEAPADLKALARADSVALDPHKWLYAPLEAGCTLVRDPQALHRAFSFRPEYYHFDDDNGAAGVNYYEHGLQNSRGFRALKVWLALRHVGREGYEQMIRDDIALACTLAARIRTVPELELGTQRLSITTFRYLPAESGLPDDYVDRLNSRLVAALQAGGQTYLSNAVVNGRQFLRTCIVNFRTRVSDVESLPEQVVREGRRLAQSMPPRV